MRLAGRFQRFQTLGKVSLLLRQLDETLLIDDEWHRLLQALKWLNCLLVELFALARMLLGHFLELFHLLLAQSAWLPRLRLFHVAKLLSRFRSVLGHFCQSL